MRLDRRLGWELSPPPPLSPSPPLPPLLSPSVLKGQLQKLWPLHQPSLLQPGSRSCVQLPEDPASNRPMVSPWPALCVLLLALPGALLSPTGLLVCSVPDVLRHYRAVIFEDLQAAVRRVRPGAAGTRLRGREATRCGAQKEDSILVSIASLGQTLRGAASHGRRGALEKAAWTVALRTENVCKALLVPSTSAAQDPSSPLVSNLSQPGITVHLHPVISSLSHF
ncbi:uncharacterized protein C20orf204 homolog [Echinops telfairi]|uniref:Uncharacterized protein C20orf204 homolog n=1 Tax=Echinops telfairi TaxID=9371 RepID=A0AC55DM97_ECHTE|nr:uncharacterized protein C20orf204 homolog [Echinops telfairi]